MTKEYKMIRLCIMPLIILCCVMLHTFISHGETYTCGDYEYKKIDSKRVRIVGYNGEYTEVLNIPDTLDGYAVTVIGKETGGDTIEWNADEIHIPEGVMVIESWTFTNNMEIKCIYIPKSVLSICDNFHCLSMENIFVDEENIKYCDIDGVLYSKDLKTIYSYPKGRDTEAYEINAATETIADNAFSCCCNLRSVSLSPGLKEIGSNAFEKCYDLREVISCSNVRKIDSYAFMDCSKLGTIDMGENVEYIGHWAFAYCNRLKEIDIPKNVSTIEAGAFRSCALMESINVDADNDYFCSVDGVLYSKDMKTLYQYPVNKNDPEYSIPDGVIKIVEGAFVNCINLEKIEISESVRYISEGEFAMSAEISALEVDPDNRYFQDVDGVLFSRSDYKLICYPGGKRDKEYTVPKGVQVIGYDAFSNARFNKLVVSDGVKELHFAFLSGADIRTVIFPGSIDNIHDYAFVFSYTDTKVYVEKDSSVEEYMIKKSYEYEYISNEDVNVLTNEAGFLLWDDVFPDENFLKVLDNYDENNDNSLSKEERSYITEIKAAGMKIRNLSGIEYFDELKVLDCHSNYLRNIDLSGNEKLSVLYCWDNLFDKVDVSGFADEEGIRLKYDFSEESETVKYAAAYKDYAMWGGSIEYDSESKVLNYINPEKPADTSEENKDNTENTENSNTENSNTENSNTENNNTENNNTKNNNTQNDQNDLEINTEGTQTDIGQTGEKQEEAKQADTQGSSKERTIIFARSYSKKIGDKQFYINPQTNSNATLAYSSSNKNVCKVSNKGKVTIKGCGKTVITIKAPETSAYEAGAITVTIKVLPGQVALKSVKSPKKSQIYFSWKKIKGATKYQYNVSRKKNFKGAKLYSTKSISKKIMPSSDNASVSGKGFYIRVRAVAKIGGKTYYGKWSKTKYVKVK